ncbi:orphan sodium- and chloride-dependent neurotransmitter transporter NTT5 isoform X3 [Oryctolagus cuniculus]|uniref:orphan sodium- and chloride-dependent neurotransmitter transporter NTT5 isoform X3 n=1 Tax=Oryctolagus cuniculus TaxID=9986 RepID=UPI003879AE9A
MSSAPEGKPSLGEAGAAPESLPEMKTEAQALEFLMTKSSSTETKLSDGLLGTQAWEDKGPVPGALPAAAYVSEAQATATRAAMAQAWETQAFVAKARTGNPKQTALPAVTSSMLKQTLSDEKFQMTENKESKIFTRPLWAGKVEYILSQLGYSVRPSNIWHFIYIWIHYGGCSFFVIYILLLFLVGVPLLFLELAAGQRMRLSNMSLWKIISPWAGGVGYTSFTVMYVLVPLPYFFIVCFLFWSLLQDGATYGLQHLVVAKISSMYNIQVWSRAGCQVLFDLGLGFGPVASLSSHMDQSNNCLTDAFVMAVVNLFTLVITIPFIFSLLGLWATVITHRCSEKNVEMLIQLIALGELPAEVQPPKNLLDNPSSVYNAWLDDLPQHIRDLVLSRVPECDIKKQFLKYKEGYRFIFLNFIEATSFLPGSIFWSMLFFVTVLILGLSTIIGFMQGLLIPLQDTFSSFRRHRKLFSVFVSMLLFLCGLFFLRPPGVYFFSLLHEHWTVLPIIIIVMFENITIVWAYGSRRFLEDLTILLGHPISPIYGWLWCSLCPVMLLVMLVVTVVRLAMKNLTYVAWDSSSSKEVIRRYPSWALVSMIILWLAAISPIPAYFVYCLINKIPFRSKMEDKQAVTSSSLFPSNRIMPGQEVQKAEILQDKAKADQPAV